MKRILLLTFSTVAIASISQAQFTKGTLLLGGTTSFFSNKRESPVDISSSDKVFTVSPSIGKAVKENRIAGAYLRYDFRESESHYQSVPSGSNYRSYGAGFFVREYFSLNKSFFIYGEPSIYGGVGRQERSSSNTKPTVSNNWHAGFSLSAGITYVLSRKFHLEVGLSQIAGLNYEKWKTKDITPELESHTFSFSTNLSSSTPFNVGLRFLLPK